MDYRGTSDPYVKLHLLPGASKVLFKILYTSLWYFYMTVVFIISLNLTFKLWQSNYVFVSINPKSWFV